MDSISSTYVKFWLCIDELWFNSLDNSGITFIIRMKVQPYSASVKVKIVANVWFTKWILSKNGFIIHQLYFRHKQFALPLNFIMHESSIWISTIHHSFYVWQKPQAKVFTCKFSVVKEFISSFFAANPLLLHYIYFFFFLRIRIYSNTPFCQLNVAKIWKLIKIYILFNVFEKMRKKRIANWKLFQLEA